VLIRARRARGVELTALRNGPLLEVANGRMRMRFAIGPAVCPEEPVSLALLPGDGYRCPSDFDDPRSKRPFLMADLARFLTAPGHPDALVLAEPDVSFDSKMKGSHGGPTAEEMLVPILLRNVRLGNGGITRTSDLLKFLRGRNSRHFVWPLSP
jgi:hypothetical protein